MTDLTKPVSRRCREEHPRHRRRVMATLSPGDVLSLRLERSGREFHLPLNALYDQAELAAAKASAGFDAAPCRNPKTVRNV